jgi:hypothetical protein
VTAFFLLLAALGAATGLSSVLWRRLARLLGRPARSRAVLLQPTLGAALVVAGVAGLLVVR